MDTEQLTNKAQELGERFAAGPEEVLQEIEDVLPPAVRDQVARFPLTACALGVVGGIILGIKKGDELLAAGAAMVSAAVTANVNSVLGEIKNHSGEQ